LALAVLVTVALGSFAPPARADTGEVTMSGLAFTPETITVQMSEGEPEQPAPHAHVNFVNRDQGVEHVVAFDDRSIAVGSSGRLTAGGPPYTVIFEEPGMFLFRCEIHPGMAGTVVVTAPAGSDREEREGGDGSGTSVGLLIAVAAVAAATGAAAVLLVGRRRRTAEPEKPGRRPTR
jgi:plastocyanin